MVKRYSLPVRFAALLGLGIAAVLLAGCDSGGPGSEDDDCPHGYEYCIDPVVVNVVDAWPDWGPDGRIAYTHYVSQYGEPNGLWVLDPQTGARRFVTEGGKMPSWSPDGEHIAFMAGQDIHTVEVETGEVELVIDCGWCASPAWSPDGERIAFKNVTDEEGFPAGLWLINPDGSGLRQILAHRNDPGGLDWAPDGERVVVTGYFDTGGLSGEIMVADTLGERERRLTRNTASDQDPAWSPDGNWIAWRSNGEGADPRNGIWLMRSDGSNSRQLTRGGGFPTWSPDGRQIVYFKTFDEGEYDSPTQSMWIMSADGSNQRPLTRPEDYREYANEN